jgi:hypothetical protein
MAVAALYERRHLQCFADILAVTDRRYNQMGVFDWSHIIF